MKNVEIKIKDYHRCLWKVKAKANYRWWTPN